MIVHILEYYEGRYAPYWTTVALCEDKDKLKQIKEERQPYTDGSYRIRQRTLGKGKVRYL